jgi:hypothetical protein
MGVHCVAHHINLAVQYLGNLTFIYKIEGFYVERVWLF